MTIVNNTAHDYVFEIDVDSPLKGQVSRVAVSANSSATIGPGAVLLLVLDNNFQAAITAGDITLQYAASDITWLTNVILYLTGAL